MGLSGHAETHEVFADQPAGRDGRDEGECAAHDPSESWALKLRSPSEKNGTGSCASEAWTGQPGAEVELVVLMVVKGVVRGVVKGGREWVVSLSAARVSASRVARRGCRTVKASCTVSSRRPEYQSEPDPLCVRRAAGACGRGKATSGSQRAGRRGTFEVPLLKLSSGL